jgi:hypothetical protein
MIAGSSVHWTTHRQTIAGRPATGRTAADHWSIQATLNGAVTALAVTITELASVGDWATYDLAFTAPAVGDFALSVQAVGTDIVDPGRFAETVDTYDIDSLAAIVATPIVSVVNAGAPSSDIGLRLVKDDYAPLSFTVRDQAGNAVDLSGYDTPTFAVLDRVQTPANRYVQTTAITMSAGGVVSIAVPETAAFYALLTPAGTDSVQLYWTFKANEAATASKTRTLARGTLTVLRTETA